MRHAEKETNALHEMKACRLTPAGRGAIQTLQITHPTGRTAYWNELPCRTRSGLPIPKLEIDRVYYGFWGDAQHAEEIVICRCDDCVYDIHCHGGEAAAGRILGDLESAGFYVVIWQENLREEKGIFETEFVEAILRATTTRTAGILLEQQHGLLRDAIVILQNTSFAGKTKIAERIGSLLKWSEFGLHLTQPWRIGIFGRPNVGKSSLLNAIAGFTRAIVYDQPGTTRDLVSVPVVINGWPFELIDTAGVRADSEELEKTGIEKAKELFCHVDLRLVLLDLDNTLTCEDLELCQSKTDSVIVFHKCDLTPKWTKAEFRKRFQEPFLRNSNCHHPTVPVSSKTEEGLDLLLEILERKLVPALPTESTAIPFTRRQIELFTAAEQACDQNDETAFRENLAAILA